MSSAEVFTLKVCGSNQKSAADLILLQQQLQGAVAGVKPGPLRDAALAEMVQLSMLIEEQL